MEKLHKFFEPNRKEIRRVPEDIEVGEGWGRADLHFHVQDTTVLTIDVLREARNKKLNIVGLVRHDNWDIYDPRKNYASLAQRWGEEFGIEVILGTEITVSSGGPFPHPGHLLAYFSNPESLPKSQEEYAVNFSRLKPIERVIAEVHRRDGFVIVPHPLSCVTFSLGRRSCQRLQGASQEVRPDGFELLNSTVAGRTAFSRTRDLFARGGLGGAIGGSDGRLPEHIGRSQTRFPGQSLDDFINALRTGQTVAEGNFLSLWDNLKIGCRQAEALFLRRQLSRPTWVKGELYE